MAEAEAELPDDVRRRLRARARPLAGWVPSTAEDAPEFLPAAFAEDDEHDATDTADTQPAGDSFLQDSSVSSRLGAVLRGRLPIGLRGARLSPSRRAVAGLAGLLAAALALTMGLTWLQRPRESPVPSVRRSVPTGAATSRPTATPSPDVVVHVTGAVRRPGLIELPGGSRVDAAVQAAGGATRKADLASVNLARLLVDGEQVVVLRKGQAVGAVGAPEPSAGAASPGQPVDLNSATLDQLDGLPGVGPVLAQRIIDWRTAHGRFSSVDELTEVSGIGERTLGDLRSLVHV